MYNMLFDRFSAVVLLGTQCRSYFLCSDGAESARTAAAEAGVPASLLTHGGPAGRVPERAGGEG